MGKTDRAERRREARQAQLTLPLPELLRGDLMETVIEAGIRWAQQALEAERMGLCGPRYQHQERQAYRFGYAPGSLVMGGRRVAMKRPRARTIEGSELGLPSWQAWSASDPLERRAMEQMIVGVSTRGYRRSLEAFGEQLAESSTSKSAVSRRFVSGTAGKLEQVVRRKLDEFELAVLIIDGVRFAGHLVLVALGIDEGGRKQVLGLHEGATENAVSVRALLAELVERGLDATGSVLVVIDGAKALSRAVREVFGNRALIQRCREHKKRNVTEALPQALRVSVRQAMNDAYASRNPRLARRLLENLARKLQSDHPGAAGALREGLDETLTVTRMALPKSLEAVLATTNPIENLFGRVREITRRVKHWQGGTMVLRWSAAALLEAERTFNKVAGFRSMPALLAQLRKHQQRLIDQNEKAA